MILKEELENYLDIEFKKYYNQQILLLQNLSLFELLKDTNFYLLSIKNIYNIELFIKNKVDAFLQSQEETMFGDFLEGVAIFICSKIFGGVKSKLVGIDLEFERDKIMYVVEIKSGPNWANSSQIKKMRDNFATAKQILESKNITKKVVAVNGCCYGRENQFTKPDYLKLCGQRFWEFISADENLYIQIIEPLGHKAKLKNEEFIDAYSQIINKFTLSFSLEFCVNGKIDWEKLVQFNSSTKQPEKPIKVKVIKEKAKKNLKTP